MQQKRYMRRQGAHINVKKAQLGLTFEKSLEYYLAAKTSENVRERTVATYKDSIKMLYKWFEEFGFQIEYVDDITAKMIRQYINYLRHEHFNFKTKQKGVSVNTINAQIRFLKAFFNFMYKEGYADFSPTDSIEYLKVDEIKRDLLTEDEMDRLLDTPNEMLYPQFRDKVIMYLAYDSFLRISELISLDVEDLKLKERKIILPASKAKGRKERIIPINTMTVKMLAALIDENNLAFDNPKAIFLNWHGERLAVDTFRRSLTRYAKKAGIEKEFTCHSFRRQGITDSLRNGVSLFVVQRIAGHEKIETTKKYVLFDESDLMEQHNKLSPMNRIAYKKRSVKKEF